MTKLLMMTGSLRKESFNKRMLKVAREVAEEAGVTVDWAEMSDFPLPLYNQDLQESDGLPESAKAFIKRMKEADALVLAAPEYNYSIPGPLKNFIDWISRDRPMPFDDYHILLMSASPALCGANRGLWAVRVPLECCGAFVFPKMISIPDAPSAFAPDGSFKDPKNRARIKDNLTAFLKTLPA